jgi:hypothetical protein
MPVALQKFTLRLELSAVAHTLEAAQEHWSQEVNEAIGWFRNDVSSYPAIKGVDFGDDPGYDEGDEDDMNPAWDALAVNIETIR